MTRHDVKPKYVENLIDIWQLYSYNIECSMERLLKVYKEIIYSIPYMDSYHDYFSYTAN